jgi:hypothetical protein
MPFMICLTVPTGAIELDGVVVVAACAGAGDCVHALCVTPNNPRTRVTINTGT